LEVFVKLNGCASGGRFSCRAWTAIGLLLLAGGLALRLGARLQASQVAESDSALPSSLIYEAQNHPLTASANENARAVLGQLPLSFEPNQGQVDPEVRFLARGSGYGLFLTANEAVLELRARGAGGTHRRAASPTVVHMRLAEAKEQLFDRQ